MYNTIRGTKVDIDKLVSGGSNENDLALKVTKTFLMVRPSDETRAALEKLAADARTSATVAQPVQTALPTGAAQMPAKAANTDNPQQRLTGQLIALVLGSPEFQRK